MRGIPGIPLFVDKRKTRSQLSLTPRFYSSLRGEDLNLRPSGYEPDELPGCSTARQGGVKYSRRMNCQALRIDL